MSCLEYQGSHPLRSPSPLLLSPRLERLLQWVPVGTVQLIDVGCDHGKLSVAALQRGCAKRVVACDLRPGPLYRAKKALSLAFPEGHPLRNAFETHCTNGLQGIALEKGAVIVIAGMGGLEIRDILRRDRERLLDAELLLHPTRAAMELRQAFEGLRLEILEEALCQEEQRIYPLLRVRTLPSMAPPCTLSPEECFWGPRLIADRMQGREIAHWEAYRLKQEKVLSQWAQAPDKQEWRKLCADCLESVEAARTWIYKHS